MNRKLKTLGLALVAVFAFSGLSASVAAATDDHFVAEKETALLTGVSHDNVFQLGSNKFECTTSKFAATIEDGDTEATVDVLYSGTKNVGPTHTSHCTSTAGNVTIDMNGCHYILTGDTSQEDLEKTDAVVWITCPQGNAIQITSSLGVTLSVPAQTPTLGGVTYEEIANHGGSGKSGVKVTATATGLTTTCAPALLCAFGGIATHSNGSKYNGTVNVTGYEDENDPGVITPATEGSKIDIGILAT